MSSLLNTKHKRKSAVITIVLMSLLVVGFFFIGLKYLDPPEEYGIAVNFGTSNFGKGEIQPKEPIKSTPKEVVTNEEILEEQEEIVEQKENVKETVDDSEKVLTQESEEAIAIKKREEARKKSEEEAERKERLEQERLEKIERERQAKIAKQKAEQEAKKKKLDALIGGVSNSKGTKTGSEGNDNLVGDKGQLNGNPYAPSYFGNGGKDNKGVGFGLNGRGNPTSKIFKQECNEDGLVVVRIEVDRQGNVIKATPGAQGTTNSDPCLFEPAKRIALSFKWPADKNAPTRQIGFVSINFSIKN